MKKYALPILTFLVLLVFFDALFSLKKTSKGPSEPVQFDAEAYDETQYDWTVVGENDFGVAKDIFLQNKEKEYGFMMRSTHKQFKLCESLKVGDVIRLQKTKSVMDSDERFKHLRIIIVRRAPPK